MLILKQSALIQTKALHKQVCMILLLITRSDAAFIPSTSGSNCLDALLHPTSPALQEPGRPGLFQATADSPHPLLDFPEEFLVLEPLV